MTLIGLYEKRKGEIHWRYYRLILIALVVIAFFSAWRDELEKVRRAEPQRQTVEAENLKMAAELRALRIGIEERQRQINQLFATVPVPHTAGADPLKKPSPPGSDTPARPEAPSATAPPPMALRIVSQELVASTKPEYPFQLRAVLQTNTRIAPVSILFKCDQTVEDGSVWFGGEEAVMFVKARSGVLVSDKKAFIASFETPAFTPEKNLILTLWSKSPIRIKEFGFVPFTF